MELSTKHIAIILLIVFIFYKTSLGRRLRLRVRFGATLTGTPKEGASVRCTNSTSVVYRYTKGVLRQYPNSTVAASWDPNWNVKDNYVCDSFPKGPQMQAKGSPEPTPKEGETIQTTDDFKLGTLYRYEGGFIRKYPSTEVARSWDKSLDLKKVLVYDCTLTPKGKDMDWSPGTEPATTTTSSGSSCFHGSTQVLTPTGYKPISSLSLGDDIISHTSTGKYVYDKVAYVHHPKNTTPATFIKLETSNGQLVLTPDHILCVNSVNTLRMASEVQVGDYLVSCCGERHAVSKVSYVEDNGVYDLLPSQGTLLVTNGYLSSPQCGNNVAMLAALHLNAVPLVTRVLAQVVQLRV